MTLLERATNKFLDSKDISDVDYQKSFKDFILECYIKMNPSSYGKYIEKKVKRDCLTQYINIHELPTKEDSGDFRISYPNLNFIREKVIQDGKEEIINIPTKKHSLIRNFEFKISYLGKTDGYTIRNIRPYQEINGGYIICLIDCEDEFNEEVYLLDFNALKSIFSLSHMNGTSSQHNDGGFQNLGASFKKYSYEHLKLNKLSKLSGTNIEHLYSYLKNLESSLETEFKTNDDYIHYKNEYLKEEVPCEEYFFDGTFDDCEYNRIFSNFKTVDEYKEVVRITINKLKDDYDRLVSSSSDPRAWNCQIFVIKGRVGLKDYLIRFYDDYKKQFVIETKNYFKLI